LNIEETTMDPLSSRFTNKDANRGAWTAEEDKKLAQVIEIHGPKRWKKVAAKAGKHIKYSKILK
jgi:myb proto-oncogene protein